MRKLWYLLSGGLLLVMTTGCDVKGVDELVSSLSNSTIDLSNIQETVDQLMGMLESCPYANG